MRTKFFIIALLSVVTLAVRAQQQEWQSTSTMRGAGSAYSPQVTAVGATAITSTATTTESYSPAGAHGNPKTFITPDDPGNQSSDNPIGDAVLPMMLFAGIAIMVIAVRKRVNNTKEQQS